MAMAKIQNTTLQTIPTLTPSPYKTPNSTAIHIITSKKTLETPDSTTIHTITPSQSTTNTAKFHTPPLLRQILPHYATLHTLAGCDRKKMKTYVPGILGHRSCCYLNRYAASSSSRSLVVRRLVCLSVCLSVWRLCEKVTFSLSDSK